MLVKHTFITSITGKVKREVKEELSFRIEKVRLIIFYFKTLLYSALVDCHLSRLS